MTTRKAISGLVLSVTVSGCGGDPGEPPQASDWAWVARSESAALIGVSGSSEDDVWLAGADDGRGPHVLHWDGARWEEHDTGVRGDLWWIHASAAGPVYFTGSDALIVRYDGGVFERLSTPGLGKHTVFGLWAAAEDDLYAVGAAAGRNGFIWHFDGTSFSELALPADVPLDENRDTPGLFKVWGSSASDVWVVGAQGVVLRGSAADGFELVRSSEDEILFTVHGQQDHVAIVGGSSSGGGVLLESTSGELVDRTPEGAPLLQGVHVGEDGTVWASGFGGSLYRATEDQVVPVTTELDFRAAESLHTVWVDPSGGVWAAGGDVLTPELDQGLALHLGGGVARAEIEPAPPPPSECPESAIDPEPERSIARRWNEQILNAIRRDVPRPTVHARNLFHLSAAIWDTYAAYDDALDGYFVNESVHSSDAGAARDEAISYAAYRVLSHRYRTAIGGAVSQACFDAFMERLGYDPSDESVMGDSPRALGNRVGFAIVETCHEDGANEAANYADPDAYFPDVPNLIVDRPGTTTSDPTLWQRLVLAEAETQNGIPAGAGAQPYIGGHWRTVVPFALERDVEGEPYLDIGTPPIALDDDLVGASVELIRRSAELDVNDDTQIDISPAALGNNPLGTNDGAGYGENPVTGAPYASQWVRRSDFGRVLAEFWADGPESETPPGHWNTLANHVSEHPDFERRLFGSGEELDELAWDVHVYLALNGAVHDAAIAAWELKREYSSARPITLIRYMAGRGQRTDPNGPSYDPQGLPLEPGLIEVITEESSAEGERHAALARYVGEIAVRSWRGEPGDRDREIGGVAWVRALEWIPYQRRTFVTPAFPGYTSGHSTFSRAAAVVLSELTGSEFFPGGHASYHFEPGYLFFEFGPSAPLDLEWATYFDAADQAGQSRLWGGIHVWHDDFDGRRTGALVGEAAVERARGYFEGTAVP